MNHFTDFSLNTEQYLIFKFKTTTAWKRCLSVYGAGILLFKLSIISDDNSNQL